ncbi:MAG: MBL fold metallo-hydrolase, partial [Woeseiaceae bacterium]|nr:MBL fold metallo-hydrolase [Woeseiaceae bacterium]
MYDAPIDCTWCSEWNRPQAPFRISDNTWYVGVAGLSAILVDTGDGLVLIDGGLPQSAPLINTNIRALGFRPQDVAFILVSHVHFDHVGGIAALQRLSGARVLASDAAHTALASGELQPDDPQFDPDA